MSFEKIKEALEHQDNEALEELLGRDDGSEYYVALMTFTVNDSNTSHVQKLIQSPAAKNLRFYKPIVLKIFDEIAECRHGDIEEATIKLLFNEVKDNRFTLTSKLSYLFNEALSDVEQEYYLAKFGHERNDSGKQHKNETIARMIVAEGISVDDIANGHAKNLARQKEKIDLQQQAVQKIRDSFKGITPS